MKAALQAPPTAGLQSTDFEDLPDLLALEHELEHMLQTGMVNSSRGIIARLLRREPPAARPLSARDRARFTRMLIDVKAAIERATE